MQFVWDKQHDEQQQKKIEKQQKKKQIDVCDVSSFWLLIQPTKLFMYKYPVQKVFPFLNEFNFNENTSYFVTTDCFISVWRFLSAEMF